MAVVALLLAGSVAVEAREDQRLASRRESGPLVGDGGDRPPGMLGEGDAHRPVPRREGQRVVEDVLEDRGQALRDPAHRERPRRRPELDAGPGTRAQPVAFHDRGQEPPTSTGERSSVSIPASIRASSRDPVTRCSMRATSRCTSSRKRRRSSGVSTSARISVALRIEARGFFSSWPRSAANDSVKRAWSSSRRVSSSRARASSPISSRRREPRKRPSQAAPPVEDRAGLVAQPPERPDEGRRDEEAEDRGHPHRGQEHLEHAEPRLVEGAEEPCRRLRDLHGADHLSPVPDRQRAEERHRPAPAGRRARARPVPAGERRPDLRRAHDVGGVDRFRLGRERGAKYPIVLAVEPRAGAVQELVADSGRARLHLRIFQPRA